MTAYPSSRVAPLGLAIHSSSPQLGLAIGSLTPGSPQAIAAVRHQSWDLGRDIAARLQICLQAFMGPLAWTELGFIAVAIGPGGFTGTRIGVVTARTLAQQLDLPLFAVSSLEAFAEGLSEGEPRTEPIAIELAAQRGALFGALYGAPGETLLPPQLYDSPEDWTAAIAPWPLAQRRVATGDLSATVTQVLQLAGAAWHRGDRPHWSEVLPFYGQSPVV
jgi:tRNA threonylcarbamoyl adenosine modification protein YeaZ